MINVSELTQYRKNYKKILSKIFKEKNKSKIKFVRLATHFSEIDEVVKICKILKIKKYMVVINLMQITEQNEKKYNRSFTKNKSS